MSIAENIAKIRAEIDAAAEKAGRSPDEIKLIAVSKTKPIELLKEAADSGATDFGENKPQELAEKFPHFEDYKIKWHLIGHLQKNKVKHIIDKTELIHSVDSYELAAEINKRAASIDKIQNILIQVNVSGEESKFGVSKSEVIELCERISGLENVRICGLMTISVKGYGYDENKEIFSELKKLSENIKNKNIKGVSMAELSMGMTHDFEAAIEAGATMIRVGTAIFGERDYSAQI